MPNLNNDKNLFCSLFVPIALAIALAALLYLGVRWYNVAQDAQKLVEQRSVNDHVAENAVILNIDGKKKILLHVPPFDSAVAFERSEMPEINFIIFNSNGTHIRIQPSEKTDKFYLYDLPPEAEECFRYSIQLVSKGILDVLFSDGQFRRNTIGDPHKPDENADEIARKKNCLTELDLTGKP